MIAQIYHSSDVPVTIATDGISRAIQLGIIVLTAGFSLLVLYLVADSISRSIRGVGLDGKISAADKKRYIRKTNEYNEDMRNQNHCTLLLLGMYLLDIIYLTFIIRPPAPFLAHPLRCLLKLS